MTPLLWFVAGVMVGFLFAYLIGWALVVVHHQPPPYVDRDGSRSG